MDSQDTSLSAHREKVALALAVVKSKAAEVTLREHILRLRKHTHEGRRQLFTQTSHRYIDGVAFWKDCCEKGEEREAELRLRIAELENINIPLASKPKRRKGAVFNPRKRQKKGEKSIVAATHKAGGLADVNNPIEYEVAFGSIELVGYGDVLGDAHFMRHLFCYRRMLHSESPDPDKLSPTLLWLCAATGRIISSVCDHPHSVNNINGVSTASEALKDHTQPSITFTSSPNLTTLFRALSRMFTLLIHGFNRLNDSSRNTAYQGQATYSLVKLFGEILDGTHKVSVAISHAELEKKIRTHADRQVHHELSSGPETTDPESDPRPHLCRILVAMLAHVDATKPGHTDLADGFLCLLLQRAGQRLRFFVFEEEPNPRNPNPSNEDHHLHLRAIEAVQERARREEAKYLIWTLKQAMAIVHGQQPAVRGDLVSSSKQPDQTSLAEVARTRFQYTLLQGVFGADVEELRDGLVMPAVAEAAVEVDVLTVGEEDTGEWFKQELWALCGWEALGQHLEFDS